jgi:DNA polymerase elongation subunit (family B)
MSWSVREKNPVENELVFQTLDWYCNDIENDETSLLEYKIFVFGVDVSGNPITLRIDNFHPFFFIEVPTNWDHTCIYSVREALKYKGIQNIEYLERKRYYGFENNKIRKFLKLSFWSSKGLRSLRYKIENESFSISGKSYSFDLYESNIDPVLRLTHIRDILTAGWIKVKKFVESDEFYTCDWKSLQDYPENVNKMCNVRILYFDIEACSEDGSFPNALKKNDRVTQICCILSDSGKVSKYLFNLGTCDSIEDTVVIQAKSEKKLLLEYSQFIRDTDPDIIVGYNIFGFDNGYLFERAKVLNIESEFNLQSKLRDHFTKIEKKVLNNQQSGFNDWKMTRLIGRSHIDLLQVIKKDFKLESYKLNTVGEHFLGEGKDDVSPKEIFEAWNPELGTREKRTRVGKYCVQDTMLCLKLFEKFAVLANYLEMAKVTRVPLEYLITRGQSIKVFSQIAYETRKTGYLIPVLPRSEPEGKFQGATVLEAKTGYYTRPVAGLDFASLYPSIMIAHNMCYSTVVLDSKFMNLPGIEYSTIECGDNLTFSFVQSQDGVLSGILQSLWKNRKVTKKEMNACTDPFMKTVLNAKQLAIKVSMNSIYGFTGAVVGALPCLEISQSVTGCGRQMIAQTQNYAKEHFSCEIVYGDSVTGDTPVLVRGNGNVYTIEIQNLFKRFDSIEYPQFKSEEPGLTNKEQSIPTQQIEVWTASGWSPLKRTIRHYCCKNIYRVVTHTGLVDVTEDHSLLTTDLKQIKPTQLTDGISLFHSFPNDLYNDPHNCPGREDIFEHHNKSSLQIKYLQWRSAGYGVDIMYDKNKVILKRYDKFQDQVNNQHELSRIINLGPTEDFVYDLETEDGTFQAGIGQMIVKNTDSCYVIFPEPVDPDGTLTTLFKRAETAAAEISKTFKKPIELEFEKFMYPLILSKKKKYIYVEWTNAKKHNGEIEAKGMELVRRDNCQYVKDTLERVLNPIMFKNDLQLGKSEAEECIDSLLKGEVPIKKLILSKNLRSDYKGFEKIFLKNADGTKSDRYRWERTKEESVRDPDTGKNVKTGKMIKSDDAPAMAHVALVEKMILRDPNSAPKPGDRVPFVYVTCGDPKALATERVEDPEYVIENNLDIDYYYYFLHQLHNPLENLFNIIIGEKECEKLLNRPLLLEAKKKEKILAGDAKRKKEKNKDIRNFFTIKV